MRIGHGYDVHRLVEGRRLILGGVEVPFDKGLLGHSDADVLTHAVMDALLGACALGDIGHLFPDSDPAYAGADSLRLLDEVVSRLRQRGYRVGNVDATVLAQAPKLAPYLEQMRRNLAWRLQVPVDAVSVKATTEEGLGFTGIFYNSVIRAHGNHCFFLHTYLRCTCDTGDLCQHILQLSQRMQGLCNTVPSLSRPLHSLFIQRADFLHCLIQSHHLLPPILLPVVKIINLLKI